LLRSCPAYEGSKTNGGLTVLPIHASLSETFLECCTVNKWVAFSCIFKAGRIPTVSLPLRGGWYDSEGIQFLYLSILASKTLGFFDLQVGGPTIIRRETEIAHGVFGFRIVCHACEAIMLGIDDYGRSHDE
jgi:hypothetical protein